MVSNLFRICCTTEGIKITKKNPVTIKQLRICHLLTNCYVCFNGNQARSISTFNISPPSLEEYLLI